MQIVPDIIALAQGGDPTAIEGLLIKCRPDLGRYARRHCASDDVDDAVQDALWIIRQRVGGLKALTAFAGWTFAIVKRLCWAAQAGNRKRIAQAEVNAADLTETEDPSLRIDVVKALESLPQSQREVVLLKDVLGFQVEELATNLGVSVETVKGRLHRGRMALRTALADYEPRAAKGVLYL
jgi:RNA polymerase sigma factor (sigma-70 family)